jgi:hypothetical protein
VVKLSARNKEAQKAQKKAYRKAHKDEITAQKKAYNEAHRDETTAQKKAYYEAHKDHIKAYRKAHKDEITAQKKAYNEAHRDEKKARDKVYWDTNVKYITCIQCGKPAKVFKKLSGNFCSRKCHLAWQRGPNAPGWKGGISFEPYCPKFNNEFKQRVRAFFDFQCLMCGKPQEENGNALHVHHVNYDKTACCDGKPVHFAALCCRHHSKTSHGDRQRWANMLHIVIEEVYGGRSYLTKEECETGIYVAHDRARATA